MPFSKQQQGFFAGIGAYALWGVFPVYFHLLRDVLSTEVLAHRIIWSFVVVLLLLWLRQRLSSLKVVLADRRLLLGLMVSSLLVTMNWLIYISAVAHGKVVESSLGYFITPLVSVILARFILFEKLNGMRLLAVLFAVAGLSWMIFRFGAIPWIALSLALTFGLYGLARKQLAVDSVSGLFVETAMMMPFAAAYWFYLLQQQQSAFQTAGMSITVLLLLSGIVTATPLLLFAYAARRLTLSTFGFMMYVNPTLQFLIALFVLDEPFHSDQLFGFILIWIALLVF